jgi:hypothetical protein
MANIPLFKSWKDCVAFIVMNITGAPLTWIALGIIVGWWTLPICLGVMFISWHIWKYYGHHMDAKLRIKPRISFVK